MLWIWVWWSMLTIQVNARSYCVHHVTRNHMHAHENQSYLVGMQHQYSRSLLRHNVSKHRDPKGACTRAQTNTVGYGWPLVIPIWDTRNWHVYPKCYKVRSISLGSFPIGCSTPHRVRGYYYLGSKQAFIESIIDHLVLSNDTCQFAAYYPRRLQASTGIYWFASSSEDARSYIKQ